MASSRSTKAELLEELRQLEARIAELERQLAQDEHTRKRLGLFEMIVRESNEAIAISDPDGRLLYVNPAHERLFGRSLAEAQRLNYRDYYPPESIEVLEHEVVPALQRGESWEGRLEAFDAAGERFPLWERADTVRDESGAMLYGFGVMHDMRVTEAVSRDLRRSEAWARALVAAIPDMMFRYTRAGITVGFEAAEGMQPTYAPQEFLNRPLRDFLPETVAHLVQRTIEQTLDSNSMQTIEYQLTVAEQTRDYEGRMVPCAQDEVLLMVRDITERKQAEIELRISQDRLRRLFQSLPVPTFLWKHVADDFVLTDYNLAAVELTQGGVHSIRGVKASEFHADEPDVRADLARCYAERTTRWREMRRRMRTTGEHKDFATTYVYVPPDIVTVHTEDITKRKWAERLLRVERDLAIALGEATSVRDAMTRVLTSTLEIEGIDCGGVYTVDDEMGDLHLVSTRGLSDEFIAQVGHIPADSRRSAIVHSGVPRYFSSRDDEDPEDPVWQAEGIRAMGSIPVRYGRRVVAALNLGSRTHEEIPRATRDTLEAIAAQIGGALARVRVEDELRAMQTNLQSLFDGLDDLLFVLDEGGRILHVNPAVVQRLGYSLEELRGMDVLMLHAEDRRPEAAEIIAEMFSGARVVCPIPVRSKDGVEIPVETSVTTGMWNGRKVIFGIARDTTERRRAERALRESEARFRQLAETIDQVFWMTSDDPRQIVYVSPAFEKRWGYSVDELHADPAIWFNSIVPEDRDAVGRALDDLAGGQEGAIEYRIRRGDGAVRWMSDRFYVVRDAGGAIERFIGVADDITERKEMLEALRESERRFREALETSRHCLYRYNVVANRYDYISPCIEEITGYPAEKFMQQGFDEVLASIHEDDRERVTRELAQAARHRVDGRASLVLEYRRGSRNQGDRWMSDWATLLYDDEGQLTAIIGASHDITSQRAAEAERRRLEAQLQQAQKMEAVGQLAGGVAHDFNNLIATIFGYVDLARNTLDEDHPAMRPLERVVAAAEQAAGVTRSLLTFARHTPTAKAPTDLRAIVLRSRDLLQRLLPVSIDFVVEVGEDAVHVEGDGTQLQQVVMNLAINACDAMPSGGRLRVALRRRVATAYADETPAAASRVSHVQLVVQDTGVGMTPEVAERIFEPFFSTRLEGEGTGLGLSIVESIVRDHGGTIEVESSPQQGTTFTVTLPCLDCAVGGDPEDMSTPVQRGRGECILLAEDDQHIRRILASSLRSLNYEVVPVADGGELLQAFERDKERIRLLVADIEMPERSGIECVRTIRARGDTKPAILITGGLAPSAEDTLDEHTLLLRKPFALEALGELVGRLLRVRETSETTSQD